MTYYVKKDKCGITHLFDGELAFCDGRQHKNYTLKKVGLHPKLTTCDLCMDNLSEFIARDVADVLREIENEEKKKRKKKS